VSSVTKFEEHLPGLLQGTWRGAARQPSHFRNAVKYP
jgi:hypothetical protein